MQVIKKMKLFEATFFTYFVVVFGRPIDHDDGLSALDDIIHVNRDVPGLDDVDIVTLPAEEAEKPTMEESVDSWQAKLWPNGIVPYIIEEEILGTENHLNAIQGAINEYNTRTKCVRMVERTNEKNYIMFQMGKGCWSYVGYTPNLIHDGQNISIGKGCERKGIVLHEIKHALGFFHEHQRMDRNQYIGINWDQIKPGHESSFLIKKEENTNFGTPYDRHSIMHYSWYAFAKNYHKKVLYWKQNPDESLGQRVRLSDVDIQQLDLVYCRHKEQKSTETTQSQVTTEVFTTSSTTRPTKPSVLTTLSTVSTAKTPESTTQAQVTTEVSTTSSTTRPTKPSVLTTLSTVSTTKSPEQHTTQAQVPTEVSTTSSKARPTNPSVLTTLSTPSNIKSTTTTATIKLFKTTSKDISTKSTSKYLTSESKANTTTSPPITSTLTTVPASKTTVFTTVSTTLGASSTKTNTKISTTAVESFKSTDSKANTDTLTKPATQVINTQSSMGSEAITTDNLMSSGPTTTQKCNSLDKHSYCKYLVQYCNYAPFRESLIEYCPQTCCLVNT